MPHWRTRLEEAWLAQSAVKTDGSGFDTWAAVPLFREAFTKYGLDVLDGDEEQVTEALHRSSVRPEVAAALWQWGALESADARARLLRLVDAVDPEPEGPAAQFRRTDKVRESAAAAPPGTCRRLPLW